MTGKSIAKSIKVQSLLLLSVIFFTGCSLFEEDKERPAITSVTPLEGDYGVEVKIEGSRFSPEIEQNEVLFEGVKAEILSASNSNLIVKVPVGATSGQITVIAGGESATSSETFVVTSGEWKEKDGLDVATDRHITYSFMINGKVYLHERQVVANGSPTTALFWEFDPQTNSWSQKTAIHPDLHSTTTACWGTEDKGYILEQKKLWEYNPQTDEWNHINDAPASFYIPDFTFYIKSENKTFFIPTGGKVYSYNMVSGDWNEEESVPFVFVNDDYNGLSASTDNTAYIGRENGEVWEYSFESGSGKWKKLPDHSLSSIDAIFTIGGKLYIGDSWGEKTVLSFNEADQKWYQKVDFPGRRSSPVVVSDNNRAYWGGGVGVEEDYFIEDWHEFAQ